MATSAPTSVPSPAPSPEPEARALTPQVVEAPAPETEEQRLQSAWVDVLVLFDGCARSRPDLKQELLEEIENWLREWGHVTAGHAEPLQANAPYRKDIFAIPV
ncbi:hypothetical protein EV702DRAFT_1198528 [Suillus placidus]|uniref:Uncharacterized protein n=1 Tax=Suillus placidus TaxID=48579 RepID=A0A9P6ZT09_9AGAM|nr:hypothetical protein EV702DRAFT_1198528 [Suillus placidus]